MNDIYTNSFPTYEEVFSFNNLMCAAKQCKKSVYWKRTVQRYHADLGYNIYQLSRRLANKTYKSKRFTEFDIIERGKKRHIRAPAYEDRIVQRCLCDNYLVPLLTRHIIYDNSATITNRGTEFAINRLIVHLNKFSAKRKSTGYILIYDFTDYFNSVNHQILYKQIDKLIQDENLRDITHHFIDAFGDRGLGLGSQVSQICAVYYPNKIDHYFKDMLGVKYYGRYMDDGYIIDESLDRIKKYKEDLMRLSTELDLEINPQKIKIIKLTNSFTWLKHKYTLTQDNHIIVKILPKSFKKARRKLKRLKDKIPYKDIETSYKSWKGNAEKYDNYYQIRKTDEYFNDIYIKDFIKGGNDG